LSAYRARPVPVMHLPHGAPDASKNVIASGPLDQSSCDAQLVRYLGCLCRKLLGFHISEIVLR
jgi:hypothetical protein